MFKNIVSSAIAEQVPEFIRQNHPMFVTFLEAYYEWCEDEHGSIGNVASYQELMDAGLTTDAFFEHFKINLMPSIPQNFLVDRGMLAKHIKDFYASKGTFKSFKFLFRILFDEEIEIYLPKTDILRASDGKWQEDIRVYVTAEEGDPFGLEQLTIIGQTSGAKGAVSKIVRTQEGDLTVYTLFLDTYTGSFTAGEEIEDHETGEIVCTVLGAIDRVNVLNSGDEYSVGDIVDFEDAEGVNAVAYVSKITGTNPIEDFDIVEPGDGYRVGDTIDFSENGNDGVGAIAYVSEIANPIITETVITVIADIQNVVIDDIDHLTWLDLVDTEEIAQGEISAIELVSVGSFYPLRFEVGVNPVLPDYGLEGGSGAEIYANSRNIGRVLEIAVDNPGVGYTEDATASLVAEGNGLAVLDPVVAGGPFVRTGYWLNDDGKLNSLKRLQDNVFYQNYSYVIRTQRQYHEYADAVLKNVHPAGMIMFGELGIDSAAVENPHDSTAVEYELILNNSVTNPCEGETDYHIEITEVHFFEGYPIPTPVIGDYDDLIIDDYDTQTLEEFFGLTANIEYTQPHTEVLAVIDFDGENLQTIIPSMVFSCDATVTESYPGTGVDFFNLIPAPDDGETQATYNFELGDGSTPASYPTFIGDADEPDAYFSHDGTDYYKLASGTNTTFVTELHYDTGDDWTFMMAFRFRGLGNIQGIMSTRNIGTTKGVQLWIGTEGRLNFTQRGDTGTSTVTHSAPMVADETYFILVQHDKTANITRFCLNGIWEEYAQTFNAATGAAAGVITVGAIPNTTFPFRVGTQVYGFYMANTCITVEEEEAARIALQSRHQRSYTA